MLQYDLWWEIDGDRRNVFSELYVDDDAVEQHMASEHFKSFGHAAQDLAAARPETVGAHAVDVADERSQAVSLIGIEQLRACLTWRINVVIIQSAECPKRYDRV